MVPTLLYGKWPECPHCYRLQGLCSIGLFKGSLLEDTHDLLVAPGKHSQAARQIRFTDYREIIAREDVLKAYVLQAIEIEKAGKKVEFKQTPQPLPEELQQKFITDPELKEAFYRLTPGRQRGYIIYFSQAKQSKTRLSRIEKFRDRILMGKGWQER